jgi:hypothetical protein
MGIVKSIEATVYEVKKLSNGYVKITINPHISYDPLYLIPSNKNYINLYNMLQFGSTYKFVYNPSFIYDILIDILPVDTHELISIFKGFTDISIEYNYRTKEKEANFMKNTKKRFIVDKNINMIVGQKYKIQYKKYYGEYFYNIVKIELL